MDCALCLNEGRRDILTRAWGWGGGPGLQTKSVRVCGLINCEAWFSLTLGLEIELLRGGSPKPVIDGRLYIVL